MRLAQKPSDLLHLLRIFTVTVAVFSSASDALGDTPYRQYLRNEDPPGKRPVVMDGAIGAIDYLPFLVRSVVLGPPLEVRAILPR
jgi:hypothetical protein